MTIQTGAILQDVRQSAFAGKSVNSMRPYIGKDGKPYITVHIGGDRNDPKNYTKQLVANAALRYDEWRRLDDAVVIAGKQRLIGFEDLKRNGLVYTMNNAMASTVLTYERLSEAMEAEVNINPARRTAGDAVDFETVHLPIPVVHSDFTLNDRLLQESRNRGDGLDTLNAAAAARRVAEKLEDMLFGASSSLTYGGGVIYTYLTEPNINTVSLSIDWDNSSMTSTLLIADVMAMIQASINDLHYGPWMLYVPTAYQMILAEDYSVSGASSQTRTQRIMMIDGIQGVKVVDRLAANTVLLVQMTSDVVDFVDGLPIQNIHWSTEGGFVHNYKVITIQVPRVKSDYNDKSGIVKLA